MLFVIVTLQVISGGAASLPDPLHWVMVVTKLGDRVVKVPLPGAHGARVH